MGSTRKYRERKRKEKNQTTKRNRRFKLPPNCDRPSKGYKLRLREPQRQDSSQRLSGQDGEIMDERQVRVAGHAQGSQTRSVER